MFTSYYYVKVTVDASTHMELRGKCGGDLLSVHLSVDLGDQT